MTNRKHLIIFLVLALLFLGCNSTKTIYKSSTTQYGRFTIKAVTLTHCGCTHIYINHYQKGKKDFDIFYNDKVARKTIFTYGNKNKATVEKYLLATKENNFTTPFDSVDVEIFRKLDSLILNKADFVYSLPRPQYMGFVNDPYLGN